MRQIRFTPESFWARVDKNRECWEWTGSRMPSGYGRIAFNGRQEYTHRLAYELTNGPIPDGMCVCHTCDNPPCCNPAHLWLGTMTDNIADRHAKGRTARHSRVFHGATKIPQSAVEEIRRLWSTGQYTKKEIGGLLGIPARTVCAIAENRTRRDDAYAPPSFEDGTPQNTLLRKRWQLYRAQKQKS